MGALVALVAVGAVGLIARGRVEGEFRQFIEHGDRVAFERVVSAMSARLARGESVAQAAQSLGREAQAIPRPVVWLDPSGQLVGTSDPTLAGANFTLGPGERLVIRLERKVGSGRAHNETLVWLGLPHAAVADSASGTLWLLPALPTEAHGALVPAGELGFHFGVQRGLIHAALLGLVVALIASLFLGRAIARSIEELTRATRAVAAGDRTRRVAVQGRGEIAALGASFNALVESLERGEQLRRNLVTDVAHELRTPVTNLKAHLEAIEDGLMTPTPATLASLREEIDHLAGLIDELQDLALADAGALTLARAPVELGAVLAAAVAAAVPRAQAQGVALTVSADEGVSVSADRPRLLQVLHNLLDNALRHTPRGGQVALEAHASDGGATIVVRDNGAGIPAEHVPFVFERLYRADPSRDRATGGAGLGLALVKRLVEAHGGTVALTSVEGRGTTVTITLPS
jgi:signal transduction histidine kinase